MISVIIPSRNELFLPQTVADVLGQARGEIECIVILDGYWPPLPLPADPRLHIIHRGEPQGMRPGINAAAAVAKGQYLLKLDAHCKLPEGYDVELASECADDWVVVPRRYSLDPEAWTIRETGRQPIDLHYLSYPLADPADPHCGLHGAVWRDRARKLLGVPVSDEMSSQGSCWFMSKKHWDRTVGPLDSENYGAFVQEFQEIGLKTWLSGGRVACNKRTWYAHLHKGKQYGRMYSMNGLNMKHGKAYCERHWMLDQWAGRVHDLRWLVEKFWPVPSWPEDLDEAFARARKVYA